jgi:hypothetical protein
MPAAAIRDDADVAAGALNIMFHRIDVRNRDPLPVHTDERRRSIEDSGDTKS